VEVLTLCGHVLAWAHRTVTQIVVGRELVKNVGPSVWGLPFEAASFPWNHSFRE
jgi:hypothetical protein